MPPIKKPTSGQQVIGFLRDKVAQIKWIHQNLEWGGYYDYDESSNSWIFDSYIKLKNYNIPRLQVRISKVGGMVLLNPDNRADCQLATLEGLPEIIPGDLIANHTKIQNLLHCPKSVESLNIENCNRLENLDNLPIHIAPKDNKINQITISWNKDLPMMRLFFYDRVEIRHAPLAFMSIWNRYHPHGLSYALPCIPELIRAGFANNAKL
jgi:hypothetical protein